MHWNRLSKEADGVLQVQNQSWLFVVTKRMCISVDPQLVHPNSRFRKLPRPGFGVPRGQFDLNESIPVFNQNSKLIFTFSQAASLRFL